MIPVDALQEDLGPSVTVTSAYELVEVVFCPPGNWFTCIHFHRARWVKVNGIEYKKNTGVVHSMSHDLPEVGSVSAIYIVNGGTIVLKANCYSSVYVEHFRAYTLTALHSDALFFVNKLILPHPVHICTVSALPRCKTIILPYHVNTL